MDKQKENLLDGRITTKQGQLLQMFENKYALEIQLEAATKEIDKLRSALVELAGASEILDTINKKPEPPAEEPEE